MRTMLVLSQCSAVQRSLPPGPRVPTTKYRARRRSIAVPSGATASGSARRACSCTTAHVRPHSIASSWCEERTGAGRFTIGNFLELARLAVHHHCSKASGEEFARRVRLLESDPGAKCPDRPEFLVFVPLSTHTGQSLCVSPTKATQRVSSSALERNQKLRTGATTTMMVFQATCDRLM